MCHAVSPFASKLSPPRSNKRMNNGHCPYVCRHDVATELIIFNDQHFTEKLMQQDNYPNRCAECKRPFSTGRKTKNDKFARVNTNSPVYCCPNAMNHRDHKCVFARCSDCETGALAKQTGYSSRKRKQALHLNPGETLEVDSRGNSVIVPSDEHQKNIKKREAAMRTSSGRKRVSSQANESKKKSRKRR